MTAAPRTSTQQHTRPNSLEATRHKVAQVRAQGIPVVPLRNWGDAKNRKIPARENWTKTTFTETDWQPGEGIGEKLGLQPNGLYRYIVDADSHTPNQNAEQFVQHVHSHLSPNVRAKIGQARSTGGRGIYLEAYTTRPVPSGTIHDTQGYRAGEFLGPGRQVVHIEDHRWEEHRRPPIRVLNDDEFSEFLSAINYRSEKAKHLSAKFTQIDQHPSADDPAVQYWYEHAHDLEDKGGAPRGIGNGISRNLLTGNAPITNASDARYIVMLRMYQTGYTDAQILGYAMRRCDWNRQGWKLRDDCERILGKLKIEMPVRFICRAAKQRDVEITGQPVEDSRGDNNSGERTKSSGPGRPAAHPEQKLLAYLTQDGEYGVFDDTNDMLAAALYCDVRTIKRYLNTLEQQGAIERRYASGRRVIVLTPEKQGDTNSPVVAVQDCQSERIPARESTAEARTEETRVASPPPAEVSPAPRPTLRQAVSEALDAYGAYVKRIQRYIDANFEGHKWTELAIKREYQRERERRKRQRLIERIESMTIKELCRAIRSAERNIAKSHEREDKRWKFWLVYRDQCGRRLRQLHDEDPRKPQKVQLRQQPQPGCLETLRRLLADPARVVEVERYMRKYPSFDYGDVPARIAALKGAQP